MRRRALWAGALLLWLAAGLLIAPGCASSSGTPAQKKSRGIRTLEAVVSGRRFDPPGSGGASYAGRGNHYLVFETREGDATASYTFMVTETQYRRYQEGDRVQIVIADNQLREVRPLP